MTCKAFFYKQAENIQPNQLQKLLSLSNFLVCIFSLGNVCVKISLTDSTQSCN